MQNADTEYCRKVIIDHDYDRYVLSMAAPVAMRPALWALFAFHYELARVREVTREPTAAYMRLAWWDDAIQNTAPPAHDVARAIRAAGLPIERLAALIEARRAGINKPVPADLAAMADDAAAPNLPLLHLMAHITGDQNNEAVLQNLATAYGLCGLIRSLPFTAAQKRCVLPRVLLDKIGLAPQQIDHLKPSPALCDAVSAIAGLAFIYLNTADVQGAIFKKQKRITQFYLKRIMRAGCDPFSPRVHAPVPFLGLRLLRI
jgi:phytoene/squalene synthetase